MASPWSRAGSNTARPMLGRSLRDGSPPPPAGRPGTPALRARGSPGSIRIRSAPPARGSAFHTGERDAFDECLLREEEQDDHREHEHDGGGHLLVPQNPTMDRGELLQPHRERPDLVVVERVDQRAEEVVPAIEELEEAHGC